jgi:hypothetical protein
MTTKEAVIEQIRAAFGGNAHPGEAYLQGSTEGCEPYEEVEPFKRQKDWQAIAPEILDLHADALSFFSEAGFRFFLPAYLIADVRGELQRADPLFHLVGGFSVSSVEVPAGTRVFVRQGGGFTREEAEAIVAYLRYRQEQDTHGIEGPQIDAAVDAFWRPRAEHAPTAASLEGRVKEEDAFVARLRDRGADES